MDKSAPSFLPVVGHETVQKVLKAQVSNPVSALLFLGPAGVGKTFSAVHFAWQILNSQKDLDYKPSWENLWQMADPNFLWIKKPEDVTRMGIGLIHELQKQIALGPRLNSKFLFVLIEDAHTLTTEAANALLKTLEEPPVGVHFLVTASLLRWVPATIRSRCLPLHFGFLSESEVMQIIKQNNWDLTPAIQLILKSSGQLAWLSEDETWRNDLEVFFENCRNLSKLSVHDAMDLASELSVSKEKATYFLHALLYFLRQNQKHVQWNVVLDTLKSFAYNVNLKLQLENMFLKLGA